MTAAATSSDTGKPSPNMPPFHNKIVLKRAGKKTMRFAGDLIAEATGYRRTTAHWYDIGVFSRVVGGYAVSIRHFTKSQDQRDRFTAERFDRLEDAAAFLETYDPQADLIIGFDPAAATLSPAQVTILAAGLRTRAADISHAYACVVSEVLDALDEQIQSSSTDGLAA